MSSPRVGLSPLLKRVGDLAREGRGASPTEGLELARACALDELLFAAGRVREAHFGNRIECCSIVSVKSGRCSEDCKFCAQSGRYETGAREGDLLDVESVRRAARFAAGKGARGLGLVSSGRGPSAGEMEELCGALAAVAEEGMVPHASLGMLSPEGAGRLAACGVRVYNHNLETARSYFPEVCSTHAYDERLAALEAVREAGMERCSGGIFGIGESWEQRAELAAELARLEVERVPINFLNPVPGTPFGGYEPLEAREALRIVALFRLMLPRARIQVCGGRELVLVSLQPLAFAAGATGFLLGDYLTTRGRPPEEDLATFRDLGLEVEG